MKINHKLYRQELQTCYDQQAQHFDHTRKKERPEFEQILAHLPEKDRTKKSVLDIGCGSGRLYPLFVDHFGKRLSYEGVDLAPGMIELASKTYPKATFVRQEMNAYLASLAQESHDVVVGLASFHHLSSMHERLICLQHIYRILKYDGVAILINRSYSDWFVHQYRREIAKAVGKSLLSLNVRKWNDLLIPFKDPKRQKNKKVYRRYYHLFTLSELKELAELSGFVVEELSYIQQNGALSQSWKGSRNSLLVLRKRVSE